MTKESKKKEDEIKEAVANCEPPQLAVTYYDRKNIYIETLIRTIRGQKVMLDSDLAMLYGVTTSRLNEQVKRNNNRFPDDFMFQLTKEEWSTLKSQIAISKVSENVAVTNLMSQIAISSWGGARKAPYAFTRNGIRMLSSVLRSGTLLKVINHIEKNALVIFDDLGLQPLDDNSRLALLQILEDCYERKSVIITSQLPIAKWYDYIKEPTLADAIMDRLTANARRIELKGQSLRRKSK